MKISPAFLALSAASTSRVFVDDDKFKYTNKNITEIVLDTEQACFSGNVIIEEDWAIAMYPGTEVGTMVAVSTDPLLLNWKKVTGQAVIPEWRAGPPPLPNRIFDPAIFKEGDYYYTLTAGQTADGLGGKNVRATYLHRSSESENW